MSDQLSWTHYKLLMRIENENIKNFILKIKYY
nr:MAG TPA: Protein of unknown function (DUF1016) [Caudoviricetes sp.]